jgi:hypothetical protein
MAEVNSFIEAQVINLSKLPSLNAKDTKIEIDIIQTTSFKPLCI